MVQVIQDGDPATIGVHTPLVLGIARTKGSVKILLRIEAALRLKELRGIEAFAQQELASPHGL